MNQITFAESVSLGSIPYVVKGPNADTATAAGSIFGEGLTADDAQGSYEAVHDSICTESMAVANKATEKGIKEKASEKASWHRCAYICVRTQQ